MNQSIKEVFEKEVFEKIKWFLFGAFTIAIIVTVVLILLLNTGFESKKYSLPECYLIERYPYYSEPYECMVGYETNIWDCNSKFLQCCKAPHYILQGVYGDMSCWWTLNESMR
jgi:hypothetical protein